MTDSRRSVPEELIKVLAYYRWLARCELVRYAQHRLDHHDWYEAEKELNKLFNSLDAEDWESLSGTVYGSKLQINQQAIETRAYYKWEARCRESQNGAGTGSAEKDWCEAVIEERQAAFASLFLRTCSCRKETHVPSGERDDDLLVTAPADML
ncbi:hypothetical protein [Gimesia algae]|uniref:Uncharacterized protein n=1 Tax=Gimesia algae TaxID=2527971 RepID=A0A517V6H2_9PLAN|nr:hypothetical protein [Gimesia algae]QDT88600.1 hypothetical protein Pan161_02180 [Gimesia algae]